MEHNKEPEENPLSNATVLEVVQESETIKRIVLQVKDNDLSFKAGHWVDFFIPGVSVFTGYSMCSAPHLLEESRRLELAIKGSDYPPTQWVHSQCKAGDTVQVRVGCSSFFYEITPDAPVSDLLLLAAGIGINPMYSIYQHFIHNMRCTQESLEQSASTQRDGGLSLLYCAQTPKELVFQDQIRAAAKSCPNVDVQFFSTRQSVESDVKGADIINGRITAPVIKSYVARFDKTRLQAYICGPPGFIDDMESYCAEEGLNPNQIHYEKWW